MSDPRPQPVPMSRFLTVPLEIRRKIYRILLLDPSETYLSTPWEQKDDHNVSRDEMVCGSGAPGNFFEYNYNDDDKDAQHYLSMDQAFQETFTEAPWEKKSIWKPRGDPFSNVRRYPNILRTNRQIYCEASSMLYSEIRVNLQPGDVLCMKASKDIVTASERVWRHNPLDGIGTTNGTGQRVYSKPILDGVMEPHVLARFRKFAFELCINWEAETLYAETDQTRENYEMQHGVAPSLFVHENMTVDPQDEANLLAFYRNSTLIHQLVKILSNSPDIVSLEMSFEFQVLVRDGLGGDSDLDDEEDEAQFRMDDVANGRAMEMGGDSDLDDDEDEAQFRMDDVANGRAMEIFMDGGFFAPLEKLSNVRSFGFQFARFNHDGEDYEPKPRHDRMLTDLKQKIKDNYARRHQ